MQTGLRLAAGDPSKDQAQQDEVNCVWEQVPRETQRRRDAKKVRNPKSNEEPSRDEPRALGAEGGQPAAGDKRSPGPQIIELGKTHPDPRARAKRAEACRLFPQSLRNQLFASQKQLPHAAA